MFPPDITVFASGPTKFLAKVRSKLLYHWGGCVFAVEVPFDQCQPGNLYQWYNRWAIKHVPFGLLSTTVSHADFGSVTLACHYLCFHSISSKRKVGVPCIPWTLSHILNAAKKLDGWGGGQRSILQPLLWGPCRGLRSWSTAFFSTRGCTTFTRPQWRLLDCACSSQPAEQKGGCWHPSLCMPLTSCWPCFSQSLRATDCPWTLLLTLSCLGLGRPFSTSFGLRVTRGDWRG
jgi:hypothetical protein